MARFELLTQNRLLSKFLSLSSVFGLGMVLAVLSNMVLARTLTVADFGRFGLTISTASVLAIPVMSGMPLLLTREVARYSAASEWRHYRGLIASAQIWIASFSALIAVGYLAYRAFSSGASHGSLQGTQLVLAVLLVPIISLNAACSGAIRGFGQQMLAAAPVQIVQPLLLIVGFLAIAVLNHASAASALSWYMAATVLTLVISTISLQRVQPSTAKGVDALFEHKAKWGRSLLSFGMLSGVIVLSTQLVILVMGYYGQEEAVAYMRVAERGAQLVVFPLMVIDTLIGPHIVQIMNSGDNRQLRRLSRQSTWINLAASLPIAIILVVWGKAIISLTFGPNYAHTAYLPMLILVCGQLAFILMGSAGMFLAMSGHEKHNALGHFFGLAVLIGGALTLVPSHGAVGGAISACLGLIATKLYLFAMARRKLAIWTGIF